MKPSRSEIRRQMRQYRRGLDPHLQQQMSLALCRQITLSSLFRYSGHIAFYLPNDGEIDLRPLIDRALDMGKRCYLPVLSPLYHNRLWFAPYHRESRVVYNRFGIPEPAVEWGKMRTPWTLDLILTPLVAFDSKGNRLGMGGGYYDRTLAYLTRRRYWRKPRLLGTAYDFQRVESLPHEAWDIPLQGIATESGILEVKATARNDVHGRF
jgi:5-formyltetrahydrofolate cyclo-ligase